MCPEKDDDWEGFICPRRTPPRHVHDSSRGTCSVTNCDGLQQGCLDRQRIIRRHKRVIALARAFNRKEK